MTTHEGAPMSTHPEVVTLDPASNDDALRLAAAIRSVCDIDGRWDAAEILQALAAPTLPNEPPEHSVVRAGSYRLYRDDIDPAGTPYRRVWFVMYGPDYTAEWMTWPEVCALGTPEVLEPESVKAQREELREANRVIEFAKGVEVRAQETERCLFNLAVTDPSEGIEHAFDVIRDRTESLLEEVRHLREQAATEDEPAEPAPVEVTRPLGSKWRDRYGAHWEVCDDGCLAMPGSSQHRDPSVLEDDCGPLTLVETGGQS